MTRRPTPSQMLWPDDSSDAALAVAWALNVTAQVLDWTWRAFDVLQSQLWHIDLTQSLEQIERDVARLHFVQIQILFQADTDGFGSFVPAHEWPEMESRATPSAKPPAYDLAFVSISNHRWSWPLEAKVLSTAGALADYLGDVNDKFVTGIAAPSTSEGAMIGYLLFDDTETVFANLEQRLMQSLESVAEFPQRPHRISWHARALAPNLRLHHLLMVCVRGDDSCPNLPIAR